MYGYRRTRPSRRWPVTVAAIVITAAVTAGVLLILERGNKDGAALESVMTELNAAREHEAELESKLRSSESENDRLGSENERLESENDRLGSENERLESELDRIAAELELIEAWTGEDGAVVDPFEIVTELLKYPPVSYAGVALYYEDIKSGYSYSFNPYGMFYGASLVKLPFALELLSRLETMEDDGLDDIFVYTEDSWQYGSGTIVDDPPGTEYTYYELLIKLLGNSDNVAFEELSKKYGYSLIADFTAREGLSALSYDDWSMNAADCVKILRKAYEYIEGEYKYSDVIKETMLGSRHRDMLCTVGRPVAHKYGWDEYAYHDMGIVYGTDKSGEERPYYLIILTELDSGSDDPEVSRYIQTLVRIVDKIHTLSAGAHKA